ncbi:MAG: hypothetical protein KI785_00385 [Devosiaceae bacterium]|nr:hypothetical protein [Devosiaceae bacterium MH13]
MRLFALMITLLTLVPAMMTGLAREASASQFTGQEIRSAIIGHTIYLAAPFGGEFPLNYRRSGQVDGDGEASGFAGRMAQPRDRGRWWIDGNRLCQQFERWYNGSPMCFDLTRTGPDTLRWVRDNGQTGRARIGERI